MTSFYLLLGVKKKKKKKKKKNSCVSANPTGPASNTRLCYFLLVKMQNKKVKHQPSTKYLYFHKNYTSDPVLFWRKQQKKKFLLPTDHFFQHVSGNAAIVLFYALFQKTGLVFHAECLHHRQSAWNVKFILDLKKKTTKKKKKTENYFNMSAVENIYQHTKPLQKHAYLNI